MEGQPLKKKEKVDELARLIRLTKLIQKDKVKVEPIPLGRGPNKWRSKDPKFAPKPEKPTDLVDGGGMQVDPSRQAEYEQWRQDKIAEQNERRESALRRAAARRQLRDANRPPAV